MNFTRKDFIRTSLLGAAASTIKKNSVLNQAEPEPLFNGKTLDGWHTTPRVYVPSRIERFKEIPAEALKDSVIEYYRRKPEANERAKAEDHGIWKVEHGAIVGGQTPQSKRGSYLISNDKYADFELTLDAKPDWPADTGIMLRAHELGSVGFQVLLDHRPGGAIGGVYGNSVGNFRAYPFVIDGDEKGDFKVENLRKTTTDKDFFKPDYSASAEKFLSVWKPNDWNTFKIKCYGRMPIIEISINGLLISKLDTSKLSDRVPGYNPVEILNRIGRKGHIGFEVHDNDQMGYNRWATGAVCRWKNIHLKEL